MEGETDMRNALRIILVSVLFLVTVTVSVPPAMACPNNVEIDHNYYDANGCWQGEHYVSCSCGVTNWGVLTGAHWKHLVSSSCDGSGSSDQWYEWNGSSWVAVADPGLSGC
jgi:hypothetical protein